MTFDLIIVIPEETVIKLCKTKKIKVIKVNKAKQLACHWYEGDPTKRM
jgi:hypothetical protein